MMEKTSMQAFLSSSSQSSLAASDGGLSDDVHPSCSASRIAFARLLMFWLFMAEDIK